MLAEAECRHRVTDEGFAVAIRRGGVDDTSSQLPHALDFGLDGVPLTAAELVGAQAYYRQFLARGGDHFGDHRQIDGPGWRHERRCRARRQAKAQGLAS